MLVLLGPLGISLYLPTIPAIAVGLGSSNALIQSTISLFILVIGLGQIIVGPLVDMALVMLTGCLLSLYARQHSKQIKGTNHQSCLRLRLRW